MCSSKRTAVTVLETIVALPISIIAILAIVELSLLSSNQMAIQAAARAGADMAARNACDLQTAVTVPTEIIDAVTEVLANHGAMPACIRVEHSLGPFVPSVLTVGAGATPPAAPRPTSRDYVCVSVCVENTDLAPNLLHNFCVDLEGTFSQKSVCRSASCDGPQLTTH